MKVFGIILEANPLHYGHLYFIDQIKKKYNPDIIVAIVSTSFTMRGEISLLDKFTKVNLLLNNDIDIILELPFILGVQSADYFAKNCIEILNSIKITDLAFGSETVDMKLYHRFYDFLTHIDNTKIFYKNCSQKQNINKMLVDTTFSKDEINTINKPNFTLGIQYIKTIIDNHYNIKYHVIQRIDSNYDDKIPSAKIASATSIRNLLKLGKETSTYLPYNPHELIDIKKSEERLLTILNYKFNIEENVDYSYYGLKEGIGSYIKNNGDFTKNLETLLNSLKNKKYTISLLNRCMLHNILDTKNNLNDFYLRILGINSKGINYIKNLPKNIKNIIFSSPKELENNKYTSQTVKEILNIELKNTKLYQIISAKENLYINEFKLPIRKEN